ncbi:Protein of unknown function [Actinopolyspora xinjiangensis]|uniref:DUF3558 domain-containing protein n=2 Tax=Actinopolyspora xinjiangensis TaxID=405564 RepID=A0A1H0VSH2_9ACTN|nr:Protein of unknown function [Actinopolyspora xinjiangensis]
MRRGAVAAGGVLLSVVLVGCSSGSAEQNEDSADTTTGGSTSSASSGSAIPNPKDATAVDVCELLPEDAAAQLGIYPDGRKSENDVSAPGTYRCTWENEDFVSVSLSPVQGRSLDTYYEHESDYVDFERITVHGYPGVRSNKIKPMEAGSCGMHVAVQEDQLVQSFATVSHDEIGSADPCALAKKALRLSLPSWPAAE